MQIPIPNGSFGHEHSDCQPTTTRPYLRPKPTKQWGWAKIRASFQGRSQANDNLQHIEPPSPVDVRLAQRPMATAAWLRAIKPVRRHRAAPVDVRLAQRPMTTAA